MGFELYLCNVIFSHGHRNNIFHVCPGWLSITPCFNLRITKWPCIIYLKEKNKYAEFMGRCFVLFLIISMIAGFIMSFYINIKLTNHGYITCEKISWMSPTTYVKPPSTCN
ncbi:DUF1240 domain-containing protein [Yersinia pseudotuberculosis]|uniref:DUF1240 domain-containing protein n=1 Tax=Yersinia pseudotuberculosis TaxID=633 RepID=UPI0022A81B4C|nr:DUF1240 domain-containing protein [Yersinia pseudotuberculosis]